MTPERTEHGMSAVMDLLALNARQARDLLNRTPEPDSVLEHFDAVFRLLADPTPERVQTAREHARQGFKIARRVLTDNHEEGGCGRDLASVLSEPEGPRYGVKDVAVLLRPHLATLKQPFHSPAREIMAVDAITRIVADVSGAGKGWIFLPGRVGLRHELGVGPYTRLRSLLDAPKSVAA